MAPERPLILVSNDDGIVSLGLATLVRALHTLGEVLVVAPNSPYSSCGRGFLGGTREIERRPWPLPGVVAYAVDSAPALAVRIGLDVLAPRPPALMVSGINYGENLGSDVTVSGTVGAAIEAAVEGVPSVAVSLEAEVGYHDNPLGELDFGYAAAFARRVAQGVLRCGLPPGIDILKVDVPGDAGPATPWRLARVSRQRYWRTIVENEPDGSKRIVGYERRIDRATLEPDSDIHVFLLERAIPVCPMTVDLSTPVNGSALESLRSMLGHA